MNFLYFLGRFHVLVLHFPIALAFLAVFAEWLSRNERYRYLQRALGLIWVAVAISAVATALLGYLHFNEGGFVGQSAEAHRFFGTATAAIAVLVVFVRLYYSSLYERAWMVFSLTLFALVVITGHYGGNLTHGNTYLTEYAPAPLRRLAGLRAARAPVTDIANADPYLDVISPLLRQRCLSCHNDDKQRGGLNLSSLEGIQAGGGDGVVAVAGQPDQSELYRRITLVPDDDEFMPAEGKTPLTEDQVEILYWWIAAGMPSGTSMENLPATDDAIRVLLATQLGLGVDSESTDSKAPPETEQTADSTLIAALNQAGFMARQRSRSDRSLIVSPVAPGKSISEQQFQQLIASSQEIVELSLPRAGIGDRNLDAVARLTALDHLRLERNEISDSGAAKLGSLRRLEYLNLHGNAGITDGSIDAIASLESLTEVYLWETGITEQGANRLRRLRPDLTVDRGDAALFSQ